MQLAIPFTAKLAGTGALLPVSTNYLPRLVILINETQLAISLHILGMGADHCVTIKDSGTGTTDILVKTSNAITLAQQGFNIGTDAALNTASDVIYVIAL